MLADVVQGLVCKYKQSIWPEPAAWALSALAPFLIALPCIRGLADAPLSGDTDP